MSGNIRKNDKGTGKGGGTESTKFPTYSPTYSRRPSTSRAPTKSPTKSSAPTITSAPTSRPSSSTPPSSRPTRITGSPSSRPSVATPSPSSAPSTIAPSKAPSTSQKPSSSAAPSARPGPTKAPTPAPTKQPTVPPVPLPTPSPVAPVADTTPGDDAPSSSPTDESGAVVTGVGGTPSGTDTGVDSVNLPVGPDTLVASSNTNDPDWGVILGAAIPALLLMLLVLLFAGRRKKQRGLAAKGGEKDATVLAAVAAERDLKLEDELAGPNYDDQHDKAQLADTMEFMPQAANNVPPSPLAVTGSLASDAAVYQTSLEPPTSAWEISAGTATLLGDLDDLVPPTHQRSEPSRGRPSGGNNNNDISVGVLAMPRGSYPSGVDIDVTPRGSEAAAPKSNKGEARAAELDELVDSGDWEGVVMAAARFEASDTSASVSRSTSHTSLATHEELNPAPLLGTATSMAIGSMVPPDSKSKAEYRYEIEELLRELIPEEVKNIDELMERYKDHEEELIRALKDMKERRASAPPLGLEPTQAAEPSGTDDVAPKELFPDGNNATDNNQDEEGDSDQSDGNNNAPKQRWMSGISGGDAAIWDAIDTESVGSDGTGQGGVGPKWAIGKTLSTLNKSPSIFGGRMYDSSGTDSDRNFYSESESDRSEGKIVPEPNIESMLDR